MAQWECRRCGYSQDKAWPDFCPGCSGPYAGKKTGAEKSKKERATFAHSVESKTVYVPTGVKGVDDVLGGGLVEGCVIQFAGFRGAGKSSLLVKTTDSMSRRRKSAFASSEQTDEGVIQIAHRVGARSDNVLVLGGQRSIEKTIRQIISERVFFAVFDSLQKYNSELSGGVPGSSAQGYAVASAIKDWAREHNACAIIVNQMTNSGGLKGGSDVEHDVDTIVVLAYPQKDDEDAPGMSADGIRVLMVDKNRNGPENLKSYWKMHGDHDPNPGTMEHVQPRSRITDLSEVRKSLSRKWDED